MTTLHVVYWIGNNIANGLSLGVTLVYWALVYSPGNYYGYEIFLVFILIY